MILIDTDIWYLIRNPEISKLLEVFEVKGNV